MNCARVLWTLIVIIAHPTYGQLAWQKRTQMPNCQGRLKFPHFAG